MRFLGYILIIISPLVGFAQSSTDCPTWGKSSKKSKADYFKYLSKNQGKKAVQVTPGQQQYQTVEQRRSIPVHLSKTNRATSTGNTSTSDFYTTRRYNLFPEDKKKAKKEEELDNEEIQNEEVQNKEEEKIVEENISEKNIEVAEAKKEEVTPAEPKVEEMQKASSAAASSSADEVSKSPANDSSSKVHKRKKTKIFNSDLKKNAVKKNRRIGGKHRIDRCAKKF